MDSAISRISDLSSSLASLERNVFFLDSSSKSSKQFLWNKDSIKKQNFSFPDSIIYYTAKNPLTPKAYHKLAQSCKYFFLKNPLLIVKRITDGGRKICANENQYNCERKNLECCVNIDLAKISRKIWLTNKLDIRENTVINSNIPSIFCSKIYRCENASLSVCGKALTWNDFKLLAPHFHKFFISAVHMTFDDGSPVMLDSILEAIPCVQSFVYKFDFYHSSSSFSPSIIKNICFLQNNLDHLQFFHLLDVQSSFPVEDLSTFIMNHKNRKIWFDFSPYISRQYERQLDALIDTLIHSGIHHCVIQYMGQNSEKYKIMMNNCQ